MKSVLVSPFHLLVSVLFLRPLLIAVALLLRLQIQREARRDSILSKVHRAK